MKLISRAVKTSLILSVLVLGSISVAKAQASTSTNVFDFPFDLTLTPQLFPCLQEVIQIDGTLHFVEHETFDGAGGRHREINVSAEGLEGVGLSSGDVYQVSGPGHLGFNDTDLTPPLRERTFYDVTHVVGPGQDTNLNVRTGFHFTFNNNGELTAFTTVDSVQCH